MVGVLEQQVSTDQETDNVGEQVASRVHDQVRGRHNEQDEGYGELQVTYIRIKASIS